MILAIRTGWTPDVIAELPDMFRDEAHWALFAEGYGQQYGDISTVVRRDPPRSLVGRELREFIDNRKAARSALEWLNNSLFPADETTDG